MSRIRRVTGVLSGGAMFTSNKIVTQEPEIETGLDRVVNIFRKSEYNDYHPTMSVNMEISQIVFFAAFGVNGLKSYKKAVDQFLYANDVTKFLSVNEAKKKLATVGLQGFLTGGLEAGFKYGSLTFVFLTTLSSVSAYRDKNGILEYSTAGAVTSGLIRWNLGFKGIFSGLVRGGIAGCILGTFWYYGLKLVQLDLKQVWEALAQYQEERNMKKLEEDRIVAEAHASPEEKSFNQLVKTVIPAALDPNITLDRIEAK